MGSFILSKVVVTDFKGSGVIHNFKEYTALWDTGANKSVISETIVRELNLQPINTSVNMTPNAISIGNIYNISFIFPEEDINIIDVNVLDGIKNDMPWDILIGMDVIHLGKFTIIPKNKTTMEFTFEIKV